MRALRIGCGVAAGLALVAAIAAQRMLSYGFSTHDKPGRLETAMARAARHWSVPSSLRAAHNPVPVTPQVLAGAREHWADHCASCHGDDGKGQTTIGQRLYPRAPDMTLGATQGLSDGELFAVIENGIRLTGMPGWGEGTADSGYASWSLVHFIRHLPQVSAEELEEMEHMNPKSPEEWRALQEEEDFLNGKQPSGHGH